MKSVGWILCFMLFCPVFVHAQPEQMSRFYEAERLYKAGDFEKAADEYETILAQGVESGAIYYNLGNTYHRLGQNGRAILNYERAKQLTPRDQDLKYNYDYVLNRISQTRGESLNWIQKLIQGHVDFYSKSEMVGIFVFIFFLMSVCALISLFFHWRFQINASVFGCLIFAAVVFVSGLIFKNQSIENAAFVVQKTEGLYEPREGATVHFSLPEGVQVRVISHQDDWVKVERKDEKLGWVQKKAIEQL